MTDRPQLLVIGCGALAHELLDIVKINGLDNMTVECLPAVLHNHPDRIVDAVRERVERARPHYDDILIGYADCGTGGLLDAYCEAESLERVPGAHCYEFFAGAAQFNELHERELGTFYLTDYLTKHFDRLIWEGLGIAEHPELFDMYFKHYKRLVYLAQTDAPELTRAAEAIAERMGLIFEHRSTGCNELNDVTVDFVARRSPVGAA